MLRPGGHEKGLDEALWVCRVSIEATATSARTAPRRSYGPHRPYELVRVFQGDGERQHDQHRPRVGVGWVDQWWFRPVDPCFAVEAGDVTERPQRDRRGADEHEGGGAE